MKRIIIIALLCLLLPTVGFAADEVTDAISDSVNAEEVTEALPGDVLDSLGGLTVNTANQWQDSLNSLLGEAGSHAGGALKTALLSFLTIMAILLICGMVSGITERDSGHDMVQTAGALAIGVAALTQVNGLLSMGSKTLNQLSTFANTLLPTMTTAAVISGQPTSALAKQSAAVLFGGLLMNVMEGFLVPVLYGSLALSVAHAASGHETLGKVAGFLRWLATRVLVVLMTAYVLFLTLSGLLSGAADTLTVKGTQTAIGMVPVVGGVISGAAESVLAGAAMVKASLGIFGLLAMLAVVLVPLVKLAASYMVFKVGAALTPSIAPSPLNGLIGDIGSVFGLVLGMVAAGLLLNAVSVLSLMMSVGL